MVLHSNDKDIGEMVAWGGFNKLLVRMSIERDADFETREGDICTRALESVHRLLQSMEYSDGNARISTRRAYVVASHSATQLQTKNYK